ncbi:MAG: putative diheme cytochrome c-553 [Labilithrix sp.]|nr:putative diheme cytochrome c-553 [Labilithrix sp.]
MLRHPRRLASRLGALFVLAVLGLVVRAKWIIERSYADVPQPKIVADTSPAGVTRGEMLFQSLCMECHGGPDGRATGKHLDEVPSFLGTFHSANLAHPTEGVRRRTDGELARVLRTGVLPDGRLSVAMNGFGKLGDADVAALLGYMRSGAPAFEPAGRTQPRTKLSLLGTLIVTYVSKVGVDRPSSGVEVPRKAPTVEYGRYMVQAMDCVGCHTDGFGSEKMNDPKAFAGGFELTDPTGKPIYTKNLTPDDATGIGRWSRDDFERAVTRGVTPDGFLVRRPMPLFSRLDRTDMDAIYMYLRTVPAVNQPNRPGGHRLEKPKSNDPPEVLFVSVGCAGCHGESGPHRDKILPAVGKSDAELASWILDPQATRPGSVMPSFQGTLDRAQAESLGRYVRDLAKQRGG